MNKFEIMLIKERRKGLNRSKEMQPHRRKTKRLLSLNLNLRLNLHLNYFISNSNNFLNNFNNKLLPNNNNSIHRFRLSSFQRKQIRFNQTTLLQSDVNLVNRFHLMQAP